MSFHVPNQYRLTHGRMASDASWGNNGSFQVPSIVSSDRTLWIIASDRMDWEHVSVHVEWKVGKLRTPVWEEMCQIKGIFWDEEDVVMQLHPAKSNYVNNHPHTLHLWRPTASRIPMPPSEMVGLKGVGVLQPLRRQAVAHGR